jgi:hypothetical protein
VSTADASDVHTQADEGENGNRQALVAGPLAVPALALLAVGLLRRRPLLVFIGAVLLGLALKLVDRDELTARA